MSKILKFRHQIVNNHVCVCVCVCVIIGVYSCKVLSQLLKNEISFELYLKFQSVPRSKHTPSQL